MAFLSVAAMVALAAAPVLAGDPPPPTQCETDSNIGDVFTTGLDYAPCNGDTCTEITYNVNNARGVDHVWVFLRAEATLVEVTGSYTDYSPCSGDSALGLADEVVCHERVLRFNNNGSKANTFRIKVAGRRDPITTSVVFRKGNKQESCPVLGIGLESASSSGTCVASCGNFDEFQTVKKTEIFVFKGCAAEFEYDLTTGEVTAFRERADLHTNPNPLACTVADGAIERLSLYLDNAPTPGAPGVLEFGDGWVGEGDSSATWRFIAGRWYCIGTSCPSR
jgi:hypothetical protein